MFRELWQILNTPSRFEGDPYGGLTNQVAHYALGACLFILVCLLFFFVGGEMPPRWFAAWLIIGFYAVCVEAIVQGWRGKDSFEDAGYFAAGTLTVAASVREVEASGMVSVIHVHVGTLMAALLSSGAACLIYGITRMK